VAIRGTLLTVQQGKDGTFVSWLESLGLKDFLRRHPIPKLIEWGWLVPQYRVLFPISEFEQSAPLVIHWPPLPRTGIYDQLWASDWHIDSTDGPTWFLHPFFREDDAAGKLLHNDGKSWESIPVPSEVEMSTGEVVCPYVDYFFHWQGYALIDVIRAADCIEPIINTPDVKDQAKGIVRIAESIADFDARAVLTAPRRWGGYAELMTWLSHYRAMRDALQAKCLGSAWDAPLHQRGCCELAAHLRITSDVLATRIKEDLLRLASDWARIKGRQKLWTETAWPNLQEDIYHAVEWLCRLTDKPIDDYLEMWSRPSHRQYDGTEELIDVLPFPFFLARCHFLDMASHYVKPFNEALDAAEKLESDHLRHVTDELRASNYPFGGFLSSFHQLHEVASFKSSDFGKIDFRERRPLDFYSLLAIRAEGCLMFALRKSGDLASISPAKRQLPRYIAELAKKRGLSSAAIDFFLSREATNLTRLHQEPKTPIRDVMEWAPALTPRERRLLQAFICCVLARNYFAHHHYLDDELMRSEESAFMLGGIIVTLLFLLE